MNISLPQHGTIDVEMIVRWIRALQEVLQGAAGSLDFFGKAARAVVELVGLDSGTVLFREQNEWRQQSVFPDDGGGGGGEPAEPAHAGQGARGKEDLLANPFRSGRASRGVQAVVATPILDRNNDVIGALYGDRRKLPQPGQQPISKLDAMLVEVLAGGLAAGLARLEEEKLRVRARIHFEQFFSPNLARQLVDNPSLLRGRSGTVSILFCDIRGFSRISERLGPGERWG